MLWWHLMPAYYYYYTLALLSLSSVVVEMKQIAVVRVTGLLGKSATLPCDVSHPPEDTIYLLLWFKDGLTTPIYRFDSRSLLIRGKDGHWSDDTVLGARASLDVTSTPALLMLTSLTDDDQGFYRCRVDFKLQPTKTTRVNLTVVTPPEKVSVVIQRQDGKAIPVASVVGPYLEGDVLHLTCIAHGGNPPPSVVWFENTHLLDSNMESSQDLENTKTTTTSPSPSATLHPPLGNTSTLSPGLTISPPTSSLPATQPAKEEVPRNTLTLGPLTRSDLKLLLTCEAANNNITLPTSVVVMVDMNLPPLSVVVRSPELPLVAEKEYQVLCEVNGSRPPPAITWWSGDQRVLQATKTTSADGNVTTSSLLLVPRPKDDKTTLRCIAENHATDTRIEGNWNLTVQYTPKTRARFGSSLDEDNIKEGDDVYFECSIKANPRVSHVSWRHNNKVLSHNISGGVIVSNQSLVLQRVSRAQAGRYSCHAHNVIGDGSSNTLRLDVKYAPICSPGQLTTYPVGRYEDAEVTCSVQANPLQASFQWTFNNTADTIDVPQGRFTSSSSHSVITYTPMTSLDYGTLLCWASNDIGTQSEPCVFHIVPAGKPDPPMNCSVDNSRGQEALSSVKISCEEGSSGGLTQTFFLKAVRQNGRHTINITSAKPSFRVTGLHAGEKYRVVIRAENEKGSSVPTHLTISSPSSQNGAAYQPHDGPSEAEVRDGGKNGSGVENDQGTSGKSQKQSESSEADALSQFLPIILGLGGGLLFVSFTLVMVLVIRSRRRRPPHSPIASTSIGQGPRGTMKSPILSPKRMTASSLAEKELQVESESDPDPDVIPLQESFHSPECETSAPATLLPPDRYKYGPLPVNIPNIMNPRYTRLSVSPSAITISSAADASGSSFGVGGSEDGCNREVEGGGGGGGGSAEGIGVQEAGFPLPYGCGTLLAEQQRLFDPSQQFSRSSTLPRNLPPSSSSVCPGGGIAAVAVCQGQQQQPLDPHSCPFPGLEGSLPPPPVVYQNPEEKKNRPSHPMVSSPSTAFEDDTPTTPLLSKRESSV